MKWNIFLIMALVLVAGCTATDIVEDNNMTEENTEVIIDSDMYEEEEFVEARQIIVQGGSFYFEPNTIEVEVGETIEFVFQNDGGMHDMVIPSLNIGTQVIGTGNTESFTHTFDEAGEFDFECTVGSHAANGMVGKIIVS